MNEKNHTGEIHFHLTPLNPVQYFAGTFPPCNFSIALHQDSITPESYFKTSPIFRFDHCLV